MKTSISDFNFRIVSYGNYRVTYTSPFTGKVWVKNINNMELIDRTKNADEPTQKVLNILKRIVKGY
jgi:hypothetical protein